MEYETIREPGYSPEPHGVPEELIGTTHAPLFEEGEARKAYRMDLVGIMKIVACPEC